MYIASRIGLHYNGAFAILNKACLTCCRGFYALMIIVPISLIILFSFVIFILPVTQIKVQMRILQLSAVPYGHVYIVLIIAIKVSLFLSSFAKISTIKKGLTTQRPCTSQNVSVQDASLCRGA